MGGVPYANRCRRTIKESPAHPSNGLGQKTMIRDHLADSGYSDGVYIGPGGGGCSGVATGKGCGIEPSIEYFGKYVNGYNLYVFSFLILPYYTSGLIV